MRCAPSLLNILFASLLSLAMHSVAIAAENDHGLSKDAVSQCTNIYYSPGKKITQFLRDEIGSHNLKQIFKGLNLASIGLIADCTGSFSGAICNPSTTAKTSPFELYPTEDGIYRAFAEYELQLGQIVPTRSLSVGHVLNGEYMVDDVKRAVMNQLGIKLVSVDSSNGSPSFEPEPDAVQPDSEVSRYLKKLMGKNYDGVIAPKYRPHRYVWQGRYFSLRILVHNSYDTLDYDVENTSVEYRIIFHDYDVKTCIQQAKDKIEAKKRGRKLEIK